MINMHRVGGKAFITFVGLKIHVEEWAMNNGIESRNVRTGFEDLAMVITLSRTDNHGKSLDEDGLVRLIQIFPAEELGAVCAVGIVEGHGPRYDGLHADLTGHAATKRIVIDGSNLKQVLTELKNWAANTHKGMLAPAPLRRD